MIKVDYGYMLTNDPNNPCRADGNGTYFDISGVLEYPARAQGPGYNPPTLYDYWYSPCIPYDCPQAFPNNDNTAVCQRADQYYNCGTTLNTVWLWNGFYANDNRGNAAFTILYPGGQMMSWRSANITFIQDTSLSKPVFTFISEDPYLQYNFIVRAPCIGQNGCNNTLNVAYDNDLVYNVSVRV